MSEDNHFHTESINWYDGQFVQPHHFQCLERQQRTALHQSEKWQNPYSYGLYSLKVNEDLLKEGQIIFDEIQCRLPDGTVISFPHKHTLPQTGSVPESIFSDAESTLPVFLGVAEVDSNRSNTSSEEDTVSRTRYHSEDRSRRVPDENSEGNIAEIDFRRLRPRILMGLAATEGYVAIPLLQLRRSHEAEGAIAIDRSFVPPTIRLDAWKPLLTLVKSAATYLRTNAQAIATELKKAEVPGQSNMRPVTRLDQHLQCLNTAIGHIAPIADHGHCHPFDAYKAFCAAVGCIAFCRETQVTESLPGYRHDQSGPVFAQLRRMLEADYVGLSFQRERFVVRKMKARDANSADGFRLFSVLACGLKSDWGDRKRHFFVGIRSKLSQSRIDQIILGTDLSMKIGALERVDQLFQHQDAGLKFNRTTQIPFDMTEPHWHFFEIHKQGESQTEWLRIESQLQNGQETSLALRFADRHVKGMDAGGNRVSVIHSGESVHLDFWLYSFQEE